MRINYNVSAMLANNALANSDNRLSQSLERLSSGLKVNHAKDNPAGLAMSKRMNAQIEGLSVASQNASDGVSIIETADGAMTEISEMLQRMNELAVKSANGILTDDDRQTIQDEVAQLKEEITRVSQETEFNGQKLLNGEFELKGYTTRNDVKVNSYSPEVPVKLYTIKNLELSEVIDDQGNPTGEYEIASIDLTDIDDETGNFPAGAKAEIKDNLITITGSNEFEMVIDVGNVDPANLDLSGLEIDATGIGAMRLQIGANEGQVLAMEIANVSLQNMGIENIDVSTREGANDAISRLEGAIDFVSGIRSELGAYQNRMESTINSLDITSENMTAAYSRIMDVDMAEEMTEYTTTQVITQAGTSMLAQANERPSQVLQLLQ